MTESSRVSPSAESRRLESAAKAMVAAADEGHSVAAVLKQHCPEVHEQIQRDAATPRLLSFWGRCVNVDELARATIVHPAILKAIGAVAGVPMRGRFVHAGLQHTYGYLFSLIETPYGFKRDRWVSDAPERGFGMERSLLSSQPKEGTLLANLTWFLGQIVYRPDPYYLSRLNRMREAVAPELLDYDYARLAVSRIVQQILLPGSRTRKVLLITDLVAFPHKPTDRTAETTLLIYTVQNGTEAPLRLITAFPVRSKEVRAMVRSMPAKRRTDVRLRYNAYVPGLYAQTMRGWQFFSRRSLRIE